MLQTKSTMKISNKFIELFKVVYEISTRVYIIQKLFECSRQLERVETAAAVYISLAYNFHRDHPLSYL